MEKVICDFCRKNEADERYKYRIEKRTFYIFNTNYYKSVDICDECFDKLFGKEKSNATKG